MIVELPGSSTIIFSAAAYLVEHLAGQPCASQHFHPLHAEDAVRLPQVVYELDLGRLNPFVFDDTL